MLPNCLKIRPQKWAQIADASALSAALKKRVLYCSIILTTGPIFGERSAWGIWWTWDARLTTTLVLCDSMYVSYLLLGDFAAEQRMQTLAAVLEYLPAH